MHKQLVKDSAISRAGLAQYILAFRKPGDNPEPIPHQDGLMEFAGLNPPTSGNLSHENWRRYASPAWMDIDWTNTLNVVLARDDRDERHVCPMALDAIHRCLQLWSNPGDVVLSPFMGIGSEGYEAVKMGRKFVGFELKQSYYREAVRNLTKAEASLGERDLFSDLLSDEEAFDTTAVA
jgi:DNA modification methylase